MFYQYHSLMRNSHLNHHYSEQPNIIEVQSVINTDKNDNNHPVLKNPENQNNQNCGCNNKFNMDSIMSNKPLLVGVALLGVLFLSK
jgi:hypothetical protein